MCVCVCICACVRAKLRGMKWIFVLDRKSNGLIKNRRISLQTIRAIAICNWKQTFHWNTGPKIESTKSRQTALEADTWHSGNGSLVYLETRNFSILFVQIFALRVYDFQFECYLSGSSGIAMLHFSYLNRHWVVVVVVTCLLAHRIHCQLCWLTLTSDVH